MTCKACMTRASCSTKSHGHWRGAAVARCESRERLPCFKICYSLVPRLCNTGESCRGKEADREMKRIPMEYVKGALVCRTSNISFRYDFSCSRKKAMPSPPSLSCPISRIRKFWLVRRMKRDAPSKNLPVRYTVVISINYYHPELF